MGLPSRIAITSLVASLAFLSAAACNGITGAGDLVIGSSGSTVSPPGVVDGGGGGGGGGEDGGGPPPLQSCGDRRVCVPSGDGWSPILLVDEEAEGVECPPSYPNASTLLGVPFGSSSGSSSSDCKCTCTPSGGSCAPFILGYGSNQCAGSSLPLDFAAGACAPISPSLSIAQAKLTASGAPPTSCAPQVTPSFSPPRSRRICMDAAVTPGGCASGESCVDDAARSTDNCIVHDGDVECPSQRFNNRIKLGVDPNDTRACSACTCDTDGCANAEVKLYTGSSCSFSGVGIPTTTCKSTFFFLATAKSVELTNAGGCKVTSPSVRTGNVTFNTPKTVCCR